MKFSFLPFLFFLMAFQPIYASYYSSLVALDTYVEACTTRAGLCSGSENTTNYATSQLLKVGKVYLVTPYYEAYRTYVEINPPALPAGSSIANANISLWCDVSPGYASNQAISVHNVTSSVKINVVTWDVQPTFASSFDTQTFNCPNAYTTWNITGLIQGCYNGSYTLTGVCRYVFKRTNEVWAVGSDDNKTFISLQNVSGSGKYPYIQISYNALPQFNQISFNRSNATTYNGTYINGENIGITVQFFVNITDELGITQVNLTFNNTNYTMSLWNGSSTNGWWNVNISRIKYNYPDYTLSNYGLFPFNFTAIDGTYVNSSEQYDYYIKGNSTPICNLFSAGVGNGSQYGQAMNNKEFKVNVTDDVDLITNVTATLNTYNLTLYNKTSNTQNTYWNNSYSWSAKNYSWFVTASDGENVSQCKNFTQIILQNTTLIINETLNLSVQNLSGSYPLTTVVDCTQDSIDNQITLQLLKNGTLIMSGISIHYEENSFFGTTNYSCYGANENYSSKIQSLFTTVEGITFPSATPTAAPTITDLERRLFKIGKKYEEPWFVLCALNRCLLIYTNLRIVIESWEEYNLDKGRVMIYGK